MRGAPVSASRASLILMRWTFRRLTRGKAMWLAIALAALPLAPALWGKATAFADQRSTYIALMALLGPLYAAAAIAEEISGETTAYMWSRPFPRYAVLAGKLGAAIPLSLVPAAAGLLTAGLLAGAGAGAIATALLGLALAAVAISTAAASIGALVPRHAFATALAYMLILDLSVGNVPFSLAHLSLTHGARAIASGSDEAGAAALWMAGLTAAWLVVGAWRTNRMEQTAG